MIDYKPDAALLIDAEGSLLLANAAFETLSGFDENALTEMVARQLLLQLQDQSNPFEMKQLREFKAQLFLLTAAHQLIRVEVELSEIEGQKFLCAMRPAPTTPAAESPADNVKKETIKADAGATQVMAGHTVANAAWTANQQHEVRTALNGIMGFASMLLKEKQLTGDERLAGYLAGIQKNGQKLIKVVESNTNTGFSNATVNLSVVHAGEVIERLVFKLKDEALLNDLVFEHDKHHDYRVLTDAAVFEFVLQYFFERAVRFCRSDRIKIGMKAMGNEVLEVRIDNIGYDFPAELRRWISGQAGSDKYALKAALLDKEPAIKPVLNQLNRIHGKIFFDEAGDDGVVVAIRLSTLLHENSTDIELDLMHDIRQQSPKILIVEDDRINAQVLRVYLKDLGEVELAYTGNEAVNIISRQESKGVSFNFILMDIGLPEPWNGVSLKSHIQRSWKHYAEVPFVAQTAYAHQDWADLIESGSFAGCLVKPIPRLDLLYMMKRLLNSG